MLLKLGTDKKILFRLSAYSHYNDGFRNNPFLSRDDTNKREETTYRAKIRILPDKNFSIDLSFLGLNANNGYDAFAIDNTFTTYSDRPGKDTLDTKGGALKLKYNASENLIAESVTSLSKNDMHYSYDGDWGNNMFWGEFAPYDYFSDTYRDRHVISQEIRLHSNDENYIHGENFKWLSGIYFERLDEDSEISQAQDGIPYDTLNSSYTEKTAAVFGQVEIPVIKGTSIAAGLRAERRYADYFDSKASEFNPQDNMFGGNLSLNHDLNEKTRSYFLVSRGFKGGGFNANPFVPDDRKQFTPESLWNYEAGIKGSWFNNRLQSNTSVFYDDRQDVQVKLGLQTDPADPLTFLYLTDNAAGGKNYGLETDMQLKITDSVSLKAAGALLETEFDSFNFEGLDLSGRAQSHAPNWQYSAGPYISLTQNIFVAANISGKDAFYFDDSHKQRSQPYRLVNLQTGFKSENWSWTFWVRNLFDREYAVRGFYFGDEPPDFPNKKYLQLGDPRMIGTTISYRY